MNLEDLIYAGMGGMLIAKEKIERIINKMVEQGDLTKQEGEKFLTELISKAKQEQKNLTNKTKEEIKKFLQENGCATKNQYEELTNKIKELEKRIEILENK